MKGNVRRDTCPDENVWTSVACATIGAADAIRLTQHASECDRCSSLLRVAIDLQARSSEEELAEPFGPISNIDTVALSRKMAGSWWSQRPAIPSFVAAAA